jgi:hypothetical protein
MSGSGTLGAVDGIDGSALEEAARGLVSVRRSQGAALSIWDASGIFGELTIAGAQAGLPSARTLMLLYAADLAFRLRWEVTPALEAGQVVVVVPYVNTAVAFGRAAGLDATSLAEMFSFAPPPAESTLVGASGARKRAARPGFVEFACEQLLGAGLKGVKRDLLMRTARTLKTISVTRSG